MIDICYPTMALNRAAAIKWDRVFKFRHPQNDIDLTVYKQNLNKKVRLEYTLDR